ncbi:MAG TPA: hypothetical protein VHZ55_15400 [Bryobacteraceae bacterium]|nr:hypothetical protein [Bryobacteraceae bacterium]
MANRQVLPDRLGVAATRLVLELFVNAKSFSTVLALTPGASAISATVSPPKNRSSTILAGRSFSLARSFRGFIDGENVFFPFRREQAFRQVNFHDLSAAAAEPFSRNSTVYKTQAGSFVWECFMVRPAGG